MQRHHPAIIATLLLTVTIGAHLACKPKKVGHSCSCGHDHGSEGAAPSAGGHNHGVGDRPKFSQLRFTNTVEAFVEYPTLLAGEQSGFALHLTRLEDYQPIKEGQAEVHLTGTGGEQIFQANAPDTPGIFNVAVKPSAPGKVNVLVVWRTPAKVVNIDLGEHEIFGHLEGAVHAEVDEAPEGISFPKEQQWYTGFATTQATDRPLCNGFEAYATVQAVPGMEGRLLAPVSGRLEGNGFPAIGQFVKKGQRIGGIVPKGGAELSMGALQLELKKAQLRNQLAGKEIKRMQALNEVGAVSRKQVDEAENEYAISETELRVAKANLGNAQTGKGGLPLALVAPATGIVSSIQGGAGMQVTENQEIMHVVDTKRLRLEVQVPEANASSLSHLDSICFQAPGMQPLVLSASKGSPIKWLGAGGVINADRRTVPYVLEFNNVSQAFKVGHMGKAFVRYGEGSKGLAVPAACVQDEDGLNVVYAQVGGETFQRRIVQVGARDGEWVQILSGLEADEHIVSKGAHLVRLAASKSKLPTHGCIH